ncbi:bifunctional aminoglycoside phosphotransferase/ATP-binding protein [Sulfuriferula plumbiphila]|nr:bifunctional aminoglycoside phosphotransferase/ATP-binding protein [Sulfuriferula plumbiphila]
MPAPAAPHLPELTPAAQTRLVASLREPACYSHSAVNMQALETHISHVLLVGDYAYKIKKPLDLGFLDFSTLNRRRFCCAEELRLNRRLAPDIYLDVVPIGGSVDAPHMGIEPAIEYAVRMRRFGQEGLFDGMLARGELTAAHMDGLAALIADFHTRLPAASQGSQYGSPENIMTPVRQNFDQLRPLLMRPDLQAQLEAVRAAAESAYAQLQQTFAVRRRTGWVRECHGDLHLGNIALVDGRIIVFDCIEFNPNLRWIDVMSELAFLVMDLVVRNHTPLAFRFLNAYLARSGDYAGLAVLRFYLAYRAMVRAKVNGMRARQPDVGKAEKARALRDCLRHLKLALAFFKPDQPALIINHGLSGSGKTVFSQSMLETLGAVCIRSDVERKRLHYLRADARTGSGVEGGLYSRASTRATYQRLAELAWPVIAAGFPVIADATFIARWQRDQFHALAQALGVPFVIVDYRASVSTLRLRVQARERLGTDASEAGLAVLERQLETRQPLGADERRWAMRLNTERALDPQRLRRIWQRLARRIAMLREAAFKGDL